MTSYKTIVQYPNQDMDNLLILSRFLQFYLYSHVYVFLHNSITNALCILRAMY